ncbi:hypothetical protein OROGR_018548 [Orobanche gracilis]
MVKSSSSVDQKEEEPSSSASPRRVSEASSCKLYKGVRKRKWGKFVSEIRLPNSRDRIWLGSYDTAEKAARAFDAALFCLRGRNARFNFPGDLPDIVDGTSMTPVEIQSVAARFAHAWPSAGPDAAGSSGGADNLDPQMGGVATRFDMTELPLDNAFLDQFLTMGTEINSSGFGLFSGYNDFSGDYLPEVDHWPDNNEELLFSETSSLWNF